MQVPKTLRRLQEAQQADAVRRYATPDAHMHALEQQAAEPSVLPLPSAATATLVPPVYSTTTEPGTLHAGHCDPLESSASTDSALCTSGALKNEEKALEVPTATTNWTLVRALNMKHTEGCVSSAKPQVKHSTAGKRALSTSSSSVGKVLHAATRRVSLRPGSVHKNDSAGMGGGALESGAGEPKTSRGNPKAAMLQPQQRQTISLFPVPSVRALCFGTRMGVIASQERREQSAHRIPCGIRGGSGEHGTCCSPRHTDLHKQETSAFQEVRGSVVKPASSLDQGSWTAHSAGDAMQQRVRARCGVTPRDDFLTATAPLPSCAVEADGERGRCAPAAQGGYMHEAPGAPPDDGFQLHCATLSARRLAMASGSCMAVLEVRLHLI